jgi:hypothetical protein
MYKTKYFLFPLNRLPIGASLTDKTNFQEALLSTQY